MKKITIILSVFFTSLLVQNCGNSADENTDAISAGEVPAQVVQNFNSRYSDATEIKWENATEDDQPTYKAKFMRGDKEWEAEFTREGEFIKDKEK